MNASMPYRPVGRPAKAGLAGPDGRLKALALLVLLAAGLPAFARDPLPVPAHAVIGVQERHLQADDWIRRLAQPDRLLLAGAGVAAKGGGEWWWMMQVLVDADRWSALSIRPVKAPRRCTPPPRPTVGRYRGGARVRPTFAASDDCRDGGFIGEASSRPRPLPQVSQSGFSAGFQPSGSSER